MRTLVQSPPQKNILLILSAILMMSQTLQASERCSDVIVDSHNGGKAKQCVLQCCPDDYCSKPLPGVTDSPACCPDNYCPKPCLKLPCPTTSCYPDNYCPKSIPKLCFPVFNRWLKCVPQVSKSCPKPVTCGK